LLATSILTKRDRIDSRCGVSIISNHQDTEDDQMARLLSLILLSFLSLLPPASAESRRLSLTIVYDNNPFRRGLETRWGFSCFIEGTERSILFDVGGEGGVLLKNMAMLDIDPKAIDMVVLSHIHYDHIGGLPGFLVENPDVTVYMPSSFPFSFKDAIDKAGAKAVGVGGPLKIAPNVFSTGELGTWIKEQSLVIKTKKGLIVITGCAHPGIVNIVKKAKVMFDSSSKVYLVLGGFHLCGMSEWQIRRIVNELKREGVEKVAPSHCSGDTCRRIFKEAYGNNCILIGAGKRLKIVDALPAPTITED
jgi:7,8-dihydropterin-6-yl-methyl-4-(beta-D-ribofuranosyl)aminobenzene 5'-phosphate synthase